MFLMSEVPLYSAVKTAASRQRGCVQQPLGTENHLLLPTRDGQGAPKNWVSGFGVWVSGNAAGRTVRRQGGRRLASPNRSAPACFGLEVYLSGWVQCFRPVILRVRAHEERRCSILGPTQSRISPSIL